MLKIENLTATVGEAEEAPASSGPEPLPWRSTFFSWTHQATFNSFLRDAQLTYNPTYQQNFSLSPRWYVAPMTFFWANVSLGLEVTDTGGASLGKVLAVINNGADDLLELSAPGQKQTVLLPFTKAVVPTVDLTAGRIVADPPEESEARG